MKKTDFPKDINGYHIFDYIGDVPFEQNCKNKNLRSEIYNLFLIELPSRLQELKKIIPSHIELDYSYKSLENMDQWLYSIIIEYRENYFNASIIAEVERKFKNAEYFEERDGNCNDMLARQVTNRFFRSIATDSAIYLVECLRRTGMSDIRWIEGHRKLKTMGGAHPQAYSVHYANGLQYWNSDTWNGIYAIFLGICGEIACPDKIGFISLRKYFRTAHGIYWDAPIPEKLQHSIF